MGDKALSYNWFRNLKFDFDALYPEAGALADLDKHVVELAERNRDIPRVERTTFRPYEVEAHRRLFALAKDDPDARAELAMLIAFTEGKNRLAALG